jgi:long-chain acyl-CoA synthetase
MASGGAPLDPELAWKLEALGWKVAVGYGLTETSPLLTINPPGSGRMNSAGKPIDGVEIRLDTETVPEESRTQGVGELQARGPGVFSGYLNLPEKTREVFTIDGWFRTGDLARRGSGGYIELIGRVSTMIVTQGGENVQPDGVEDAYAESPLIREAGVLQYKGRLAGIIVPDPGELRRSGATDIEAAVRKAVGERSRTMPSYQRLSEFVVSRESLPRTRLGKIKRHLLTERFEQEKQRIEAGKPERKGPMAREEMADQDRALLESEAAERTWSWLAGRYPQTRLTPDTSLQLDLGVDSLEWLNITLELRERFGAELDEEAISRIETVRDLLQQVGERSGEGQEVLRVDPLERPEEFLSPEQQQFLQPQGEFLSAMAGGFFRLNRVLMRAAFRVRSSGAVRFGNGQVLFAPNHVSYLDPFVLAAVLENRTLEQTYWAGWTGATFHNPLNRLVSRLAKTVPIDPRGRVAVSMASAAAVLNRGQHLVWFPEGRRSATGELQPFRPGIGLLLERFDIPVVPVFIKGTDRALPVGRAMPRPRKVTICFGPPVSGDELDREGRGEERRERITNALHARVAKLGEEG